MIDRERLIETFLYLVKIDSPHPDEEAVSKKIGEKLIELGCSVKFDDYGNIIGKLDGVGEPIMINAHMDTVEPGRGIKPVIQKNIIRSDGTTILGGDPKAGISAILEGLTSVLEEGYPHLPSDLVFTRGEEIALLGAINLDYSLISARNGVTFDGEAEVYNIDLSAPGYNNVDFTITGRAAHAGVEPEKGISAIVIASEIISKLNLGRVDYETTANIGLIKGGSTRNTVPEKAEVTGEIRSRDIKKLEHHTHLFKKILDKTTAKYPGAKIEYAFNCEFDPYLYDQNHPFLQYLIRHLKELGLEPNFIHSGGGTDANIFKTHGIDTFVLGTGVHNMHTTREYVDISQMLDTARFCEKLIIT